MRCPSGILTGTVHPHTRGEYFCVSGSSIIAHGSPPHAWGIRGQPLPVVVAGLVHPHTRGEYAANRRVGASVYWFTPTRVGNTAAVRLRPRGAGRFTPTRVGNTPTRRRPIMRKAVHPHTRGEYLGRVAGGGGGVRFTPTRVGNTAVGRAGGAGGERFTPTRVGNTGEPQF
mgnify:CR=1 FL=1